MAELRLPDGRNLDAAIFDLGGVLVDWNREYLYQKLIPEPLARARFLEQVCNLEWNGTMDAGVSTEDAIRTRIAEYPEHADLITAYGERFDEMFDGVIPGTQRIAERLKGDGVRLFALTNWGKENWVLGRELFGELFDALFEDIVVSGQEGVVKPHPRIFEIAVERFQVSPGRTLFVDDSAPNVAAAESLGFVTHHFVDAAGFHTSLFGDAGA